MAQATQNPPKTFELSVEEITRLIGRRSVCTLATTSSAGRPHAAAVLYVAHGTTLYVNTTRTTRKARNIEANPHVAVQISVRRVPVGPPSSLSFQAEAELLEPDHPEIRRLVEDGTLKAITSHGELDMPDSCFVRIKPVRRIVTYGLGMSLLKFLRDPLNAAGTVELS